MRVRIELFAPKYVGWSRLRRAVAEALAIDEEDVGDASGAVVLTVRATRGDVEQRVLVDVDPARTPAWSDPEALVPALAQKLGETLYVAELDEHWGVVSPSGESSLQAVRDRAVDAAHEPLVGNHAFVWLEHAGYRRLDEVAHRSPTSLFYGSAPEGAVLLTLTSRLGVDAASLSSALTYEPPTVLPLVGLRALGEGQTLLVERRYAGTSLVSGAPWADSDVRRVGVALADSLTELHGQGKTVGALWPELVFVSGPRGSAQLAGFTPRHFVLLSSLAPMSTGELSPFAPLCLAPELLRGEPATASTDVFALGTLLFHAATGTSPFAGRSLMEHGGAPLRNARSSVQVGGPLGALLDRTLRVDARERPSLAELREVLAGGLPRA